MGISVAQSCDANGLIIAGLKFPQQSAILGGTTLNLWSISLCREDAKLHNTERITFPLTNLRNSCSNKEKLFSLSLSKQKRVGYIFCFLRIAEWRKVISWIPTAQTHCWLLFFSTWDNHNLAN